jgi:threonine/homoserine/homoserine lactone efflux protein
MASEVHLPLILAAAFLAVASPGPATLAIAGTSMRSGRTFGLVLASGVSTGSLIWSVTSALGLGALMVANAWAFEAVRYFGAAYLLYLAFRSAKSALTPGEVVPEGLALSSAPRAYLRGLAIHLTNPKPVLFFGSLFSIGIPASAKITDIAIVIAAVALQGVVILHGYALLFSSAAVVRGYARMRRWFDGAFALAFGYAGLKILTAKLR